MTTRINRLLLAMLLFIAAHLARDLPPWRGTLIIDYAVIVVFGVGACWQAGRWVYSALCWWGGAVFQDE